MQNANEMYRILGDILMPLTAAVQTDLSVEKAMIIIVVPDGTQFSPESLDTKGFYRFHSGQIVQQGSDSEPVAIFDFIHETLGTHLSLFMANMPSSQSTIRSSIVLQMENNHSIEQLDAQLRKPFKNGKYGKVFIEQQPGPEYSPELAAYDLIFERYRTVVQNKQAKLYFRFPVRDSRMKATIN